MPRPSGNAKNRGEAAAQAMNFVSAPTRAELPKDAEVSTHLGIGQPELLRQPLGRNEASPLRLKPRELSDVEGQPCDARFRS